jgi:hypothetical protein
MTGNQGFGLGGRLGCAALLALSACGGTVDFRNDDAEAGDGSGAVGGGIGGRHEGVGGVGGVGGSSGGGGSYASAGEAPIDRGGASVQHVTPGPIVDAAPPEPSNDGITLGTDGRVGEVLAYDANPDGSGSAIYLTTLEQPGCSQRITRPEVQAKQPVFSPDGTRLAYAARSSGQYQIHVLDLQTLNSDRVTALAHGATSPSFSADSSRLAFITGDPDSGHGAGGGGVFDVMLLDLDAQTQRVVFKAEDGGCCVPSERAPVFNGNDELLLTEHTALIAIDLNDFSRRDVMPSSGRIPMPVDPAPGPDGVRYAYADYCMGSMSLYIGRIDGSTGDTCANATSIGYDQELVGADWGAFGYIAAHLSTGNHGLVLIDEQELSVSTLPAERGARNPAFGPEELVLPIDCE